VLMADYDDASKKSGVRRVSVADGTFVSNGVALDGMLNGLSMSPDGRQLAVESGAACPEGKEDLRVARTKAAVIR